MTNQTILREINQLAPPVAKIDPLDAARQVANIYGYEVVPRVSDVPLVECFGEMYYTVGNLELAYDLSAFTVYKRLRIAGMDRLMTVLHEPGRRGARRRGIHYRYKKALEAVFERGASKDELVSAGLIPETIPPNARELYALKQGAARAGYALVPVDEAVPPRARFEETVGAMVGAMYEVASMTAKMNSRGPGLVPDNKTLRGIAEAHLKKKYLAALATRP